MSKPEPPKGLTLNLAPLTFDADTVTVGWCEYTDDVAYSALRERHRDTHVFRFDAETRRIANVALRPRESPLGKIGPEPVAHHLFLLGKAVQHALLTWLRQHFTILRPARPLSFWGGAAKSRLLTRAIRDCKIEPRDGVDVLARYTINTRVLQLAQAGSRDAAATVSAESLALLIDLSTSNVINLSVAELRAAGVDLQGRLVCRREPTGGEDGLLPRLESLGIVTGMDGGDLLLTEGPGIDRVAADAALLEPRQENLDAVVRALYGNQADRVLRRLRELRSPFSTANGKLLHIRQTLDSLRERCDWRVTGELTAHVQPLLEQSQPHFPERIVVGRPTLLFGSQGRNTSPFPDSGVQQWGPYKHLQHERNDAVIAVVCEHQHRGRVEQFVEALRSGFPDPLWAAATSWQREPQPNPFTGGLTGKFRLSRVTYEWEEVTAVTPEAYRRAAERLLARLPTAPALAVVQIRKAFETLRGAANPYLAAKASFMTGGVPVQAIRIENIDAPDDKLPRILNNLALASYAKTGGVPWVISTRASTSHELVIGLGYTEVSTSRLGERERFVGITTLFQGDGRYVVWGLTREVEFASYADALLESLRTTIGHVRHANGWQVGDEVRLIFHVYKPLKHVEIDAIQALVARMLAAEYRVHYAFLDVSSYHEFQLFDPRVDGVPYRASGGAKMRRGVGVPERGVCIRLDRHTALLHLTGPKELKTEVQGLPRPLLIRVHEASDFDDLPYLARQVYHFTYMSWRSFFPATEPVTICYSRWIARALGNLKPVPHWNSGVLTAGALRNGKWFL